MEAEIEKNKLDYEEPEAGVYQEDDRGCLTAGGYFRPWSKWGDLIEFETLRVAANTVGKKVKKVYGVKDGEGRLLGLYESKAGAVNKVSREKGRGLVGMEVEGMTVFV